MTTPAALPWFAEALRLDRDDPAAAATHRLRLGTLLNQCPILDMVFTHGGNDPLGRARHVGPAARYRLGRPHGPDLGRRHRRGGHAPLAHDGPVNWVEFQSDGTRLLTASDDGTVRIWNTADGRPDGGRPARSSDRRCAWPGSVPTAGGSSRAAFNGTVRLWDADAGTSVGHAMNGWARSYSAWPSVRTAGRSPSGAGDGNASLWQVTDGGLRLIGKIDT